MQKFIKGVLVLILFFSPRLQAQNSEEKPAPPAGPHQVMAHMKEIPAQVLPPPKPIFDPRTYGAKGDGVTYDTEALQKAIDACAGSGGSVVLKGGRFLSAHLTLKGGMTFYLERDAVLLGGTNPEDYPVVLPEHNFDKALCRSLLYADQADHLVLDGQGTIDGQGKLVKMYGKEPMRPSLIRIFNSKDVTVRNLTLANSRMWTQIYLDCQKLTIDHETVNSGKACANLDGMDLCDCSDSVVSNCHVNSDDDSICLKSHDLSGLHNITIENNWIRNSGANAIKIGTASRGPITGLYILNNTIYSATYGGLCLESVDGSAMTDVRVDGLDIYHVAQPIFIRLAQRSGTAGSIDGVTIKNLRALATHQNRIPSLTITGLPQARIGKVLLQNCYIEMPGGQQKIPQIKDEKEKAYPQSNLFGNTPAYGIYVRHADGVVLDHVSVGYYQPDVRPWLATDDATVQTVACQDLKQIAETKAPTE